MTIWKLLKAKREAHAALNKFLFDAENAKREQLGLGKILTTKQAIKRKLSCLYPPWRENFVAYTFYDRIFSKGTLEYAVVRLIRNVVIVEVFGMVMYIVFSYKYVNNPEKLGTVVSIIIHTFLALMFVFPPLMSYFMLAVHRMISTKVRTLLLLLMISMSFEGPAMNAVTNIYRVGEGLGCVQTDVTSSLEDVKGRAGDFKEMIANKLQTLVIKMAAPVNEFRLLLRKIHSKIRRMVESIRRQFRALSNLTNSCKRFMKKPYSICKNFFEKMFISCVSTDNAISLPGCELIKKSSSVCESAGAGIEGNVCNFPSAAKQVIMSGYFLLSRNFFSAATTTAEESFFLQAETMQQVGEGLETAKKEIVDMRNLDIHYRKTDEGADILTVHKKIQKSLHDVVAQYILFFEAIQTAIKWVFIPATMLWPFITTALFTFKFNYREDFENTYLTREFENIDLDMALRGRTKALPLNKEEKEKYIPRNSWKMTSRERTYYRLRLVMTLILSATPFCFICMDEAVYSILSNVYYYTGLVHVDYPSHYELKISGKGESAKILRSIQEVFSPLTSNISERDSRWRECFVNPSQPDRNTFWSIVLMFVAAVFLCRFQTAQVWMSRQTLVLAEYLFPDRVRPRALTLYNRILQDRKNVLGAMMNEQKKQLADDQVAGRETIVRRGMQSRGYIMVNCSLCSAQDLRVADESNTRLCVSCGAYYCIQCFCLRRYCKECENDMQMVDRVELYYEDLTDDEESEEDEKEVDEDRSMF
uniref:DC_STAMP domain-containing protein n=1 Tax=Haemonchus contortus TaxID=6289 RepID=A0A7I4YTY3_HAECO